jgi:hypothetical protein
MPVCTPRILTGLTCKSFQYDNRTVPARVYSVRQSNVVFKMMVVELGGTNLEESVVIDHAIKMLTEGGTVKVNIPHRIYRVYGRQLAVQGADGSYSMAALFDYKGRLYQIEAKALPGRSASGSNFDLVRFQQSLVAPAGPDNLAADMQYATEFANRFRILKAEYDARMNCANKIGQSLKDVTLPDMAQAPNILKSMIDAMEGDVKGVSVEEAKVVELAEKIDISQKAMVTIRKIHRSICLQDQRPPSQEDRASR